MNPNVDALSVMTYVLYFPTAKLKPGANTHARKSDDPTAVDAEWKKIQQNHRRPRRSMCHWMNILISTWTN